MRGEGGSVASCLAFIYAGLGFALGFLFFFLSFALAAYRTHTQRETEAIGFDFFSFIHFPVCPGNLLPLPILPACLPSCQSSYILHIFFFLLLAPFTFAVVSAFSCSLRVLFVYASFWFSQLKLYLLFLFSLVIPATVSWIWVLLLQDWGLRIRFSFSFTLFFFALYTFCVFVLLVESSPAKFICVLVYTFSSFFVFLLCYV